MLKNIDDVELWGAKSAGCNASPGVGVSDARGCRNVSHYDAEMN